MHADPAALAALHERCFTHPRPWTADEFAALLADPACIVIAAQHGLACARIVLDEAEILTICVAPESQNQGAGKRLLEALHDALQARGAKTIFLEVAETNAAARRLYAASGYDNAGIRRNYYSSGGNSTVHALVLRRAL